MCLHQTQPNCACTCISVNVTCYIFQLLTNTESVHEATKDPYYLWFNLFNDFLSCTTNQTNLDEITVDFKMLTWLERLKIAFAECGFIKTGMTLIIELYCS